MGRHQSNYPYYQKGKTVTPPAKKTTPVKSTPSLKELIEENDDTPVEDPVVEDDPVVKEEDESVLVPNDKDHVHTWEENHDHNLAKKHPDVIVQGTSSEQAAVTKVVTENVYATPDENDDKGRPVETREDGKAVPVESEYADVNENDDKGIVKNSEEN